MSLKSIRGSSPSSRFATSLDKGMITRNKPEKSLTVILSKKSGRNNSGYVTAHHQGGREKRYFRIIDWKRDKKNIKGIVASIEYDPNRTANIALIHYQDGEKRYILAPLGLNLKDDIIRADDAEIKIGNALPLKNIPVGTVIHNLELTPGKGSQLVRSAGSNATIMSKDKGFCQVNFPSGEVRIIKENCLATIGQVGNIDWKNMVFGKAGRKRHMGIRPTVRGVAQNPRSHPHGGGEGRSGIGMPSPKSPWGKKTLGKKTRKHGKYSDHYIIKRKSK